MGVIPNPKMAFIFPISCILALIFPIFIKYFPKYEGKGSLPKSKIKSLKYHPDMGLCFSYVVVFSKKSKKKKIKKNLFYFSLFGKNAHGIGKKVASFDFSIGNGAEIRPLEMGRKSPDLPQ